MTIDEDIDAFARLQVALHRPFATRDAVLSAAGTDEAALRDAQRGWAARFVQPEAAELRERYRIAWDRATLAVEGRSAVEDADVDATLPPEIRADDTLPFAPPLSGVVPDAVRALKGAAKSEPRISSDGEETLWIPPPVKKEDAR